MYTQLSMCRCDLLVWFHLSRLDLRGDPSHWTTLYSLLCSSSSFLEERKGSRRAPEESWCLHSYTPMYNVSSEREINNMDAVAMHFHYTNPKSTSCSSNTWHDYLSLSSGRGESFEMCFLLNFFTFLLAFVGWMTSFRNFGCAKEVLAYDFRICK